ncbi:unnamed protein product [Adineta ricciae]|uniref:Uncharacterized protein n=1 Tax=Adineta ricciae TaxID=249248 RepID=A0A814ZC72_ADIRI|nr:unnamed protein product [Adineta ricciae]
MLNILAYAGCILQFQINDTGYLQINIFNYDSATEKFTNSTEKPLIPSISMKSSKCTVVGSCLIDKGLLVLLQLVISNSLALVCLQFQSRPWICQIVYTLSLHGSAKFLATNSYMSIFIDDEKCPNGFYLIDNQKGKGQKKIEFITCSLLTYLYCYLQNHYYWLMGHEIDSNTNDKTVKIYYGNSLSLATPLVSFHTDKFIPISHLDNIIDLYIIKHTLQLKSRSIVGDLILFSKDHRILSCHNGNIVQEIQRDTSISSMLSYQTIENEQLFFFRNQDLQSIEIHQYDKNLNFIPFNPPHETADYLLIDDFTQIGWKQVLFLKNSHDFNDFILTDFSQVHVFQQESDYDYHIDEKYRSMDTDDSDMQHSLAIAQDILRKKIINADYIVNEGYSQCKQIENDIRKLSQKTHRISSDSLISSSNVQLTETNWFIYRKQLFFYVTIKNSSSDPLASVNLFSIEKHSNKMKIFDLKPTLQILSDEKVIFSLNPNSSLTFILSTSIELDKDIDIDLYLFIGDTQKVYRVGAIFVSLDDLINPNNERILNMNALEMEPAYHLKYRQAFIYFSTLSSLSITIESTSKFHLIENFQQLLTTIGFKQILTLSNMYVRVSQGNIFEHVLIQFVDEDDLLVHFYAQTLDEVKLFVKYILSKLDFQSFSLLNTNSFHLNQSIITRLQLELASYLDLFKQIPTIMRKTAPTAKSEAYRLFKLDTFPPTQNELHRTDLLLASSIID